MAPPSTPPSVEQVLEAKRDGKALSAEQIRWFVKAVVDERVSRPQAAAFLAFVMVRGMGRDETVALTLAMRDSGQVMRWRVDGPIVDKHSTGGVGDKVSLVLAPLWAELGFRVPMISGRGLGHTGGTLDKLEAIPGFRTDLPIERLQAVLAEVGCFMNGQTAELAPADRILYALRNETSTVPSIPLITASILSKKLAEGLDELSLDVKFGRGAFMQSRQAAQQLADSLVEVGQGAGVRTRAVLSPMHAPLGMTIGNALEVEEAVACLKGQGPAELAELTCALIGRDEAEVQRARSVLDSGAAYERWCRMVRAHGGDPQAPLRGGGCATHDVLAERDGEVEALDALDLGRAAFELGAGRRQAGEAVHPGVGIRLYVRVGDRVREGQPLLTVHHADRGLPIALTLIQAAIRLR